MSNDTYLAVFTGSKTSPRMQAWNKMSESERNAKMKEGHAAWTKWMEKNAGAIVFSGGPLGKTKKASPKGVEDTGNNLSAFVVVRAPSHEAAAKMFESHPHFSIFAGESVEIMPVLPVPQM